MSQGSFDEYRVGNHDGNLTRFFQRKRICLVRQMRTAIRKRGGVKGITFKTP